MKNLIEYFTGTSPLLDKQDCLHRIGVSNCPHCGEDYSGDDFEIWDKYPHILHVILEPKYRKAGCFVTVTACPKCHQLSWCHREYNSMICAIECDISCGIERRYIYDLDKLKAAQDKIFEELKEEWDRSLCKKCIIDKKLKLFEKPYRPFTSVTCEVDDIWRSGPPAQPDEDEHFRCKRFREG